MRVTSRRGSRERTQEGWGLDRLRRHRVDPERHQHVHQRHLGTECIERRGTVLQEHIGAISAFFWLFNPNFWVPALVSVTLNLLVLHALTRDYYVDEELAAV